ncbi:hypothetical protein [Nonomuraea sp. NPDC048901]|uniref:hypothetical protein n=1 Tax=Nonomuraea sp. NPDC048901 TaxID=3155627 RepID=UPI0033EF7FE1
MPRRKKRLENKTPIARKTPLKTCKAIPPGKGLKRTANPPERKASRPKTASKGIVDLVKARSGGLCEIGIVCLGQAPATERAHRLGKGMGGPGSKGRKASSMPSVLLDACRRDHDLIDRAAVAESYVHGYKVRHGAARPSEVPVLHFRLGWVLLGDDGSHRPAPEAACVPGVLLPVVVCGPWDLLTGGGAVAEVLDRFGHAACHGLAGARDGLLACGCGVVVCVVEEMAA